jgi:phosphate transport system substrate-binding protein
MFCSNKTLTRLLIAGTVTFLGAASAFAGVQTFNGAGATFPYPIYSKWAEAYKAQAGVGMNYQSIGSGGGIKQIKARTVDFGASDKPLKVEELNEAGLMQFPMVMGGVVPVLNVKGISSGALKLSGSVLADIFLGKIKMWDDPAIAKLNTGMQLPKEPINVVHRSDGSGTTYIFTHYLSQVSAEFKQKVGNSTSVAWPAGVGGKGNEGVANYVQRLKGAIGYVEYAYALQNKMTYARLQNRAGNFVKPDSESFQAAAAGADWAGTPGFRVMLTNQPGSDSWPITGATFILVYKKQQRPEIAQEVLKFFDWAYHHGGDMALKLHYVPMPESVIKIVEQTWKKEITDVSGNPVWTVSMARK